MDKKLLSVAIQSTLREFKVYDYDHPPIVKKLWRHIPGIPLPSHSDYNLFRLMESREQWFLKAARMGYGFLCSPFAKRVSPLLLSQVAFMEIATVNKLASYRTAAVMDTIKMLEGSGGNTKSSQLLKHDIKFKPEGHLGEYKHHHVAISPSAYLKLLKKKDSLDLLARSYTENGLDWPQYHQLVSSKPSDGSGRMTDSWLITMGQQPNVLYLGVFPHGSPGGADDEWISLMLKESRQLLDDTELCQKMIEYAIQDDLT